MFISDIAIKNPVLAIVANLILMILGLIALNRLALRELPDIDPPVISVETRYTGAAAQTVENRITRVLERRISGIEGIRFIDAQSIDGYSRINIEFNLNRDVDNAANDVRERVFAVLSELPDEADPPEVFKVNADSNVIMWLNLASQRYNTLELTDYADRYLVDDLSIIDGVARVRIGGEKRYAMRVWLDRQAMVGKGVTVSDIERALEYNNIELPAGRIESTRREFPVWLARQFNTPEDFGDLVIRRDDSGHLLRLKEVATITKDAENRRAELRGNGQDMIGLGIIIQSKANTLEVARRVHAAIKKIQLPPDIQLINSYDSSVFIQQSIIEIQKTFAIALLLVVLVIFFFLGKLRAVLIPFVTIPLSLISSFIVLYYANFTLNMLTLLALVIAIGQVVDDAIIVLENISRHINEGEPPLLASYHGTRQVGFAVVATSVVLLAVFLPITLLQGNVGRLFGEFAYTLAATVVFSTFVSLTLAPVLCAYLLKAKHQQSAWYRKVNHSLSLLQARYKKTLKICLRHTYGFFSGFLLIIAAGFFLYQHIPSELIPREDRGAFFILTKAAENTSYPYMQKNMRLVEQEMMKWIERGIALRALTIIPLGLGGGDPVNQGFGIMVMEDFAKRNVSTMDVMEQLRQKLLHLPDVIAIPIMRSALQANALAQPVQFVIGGNNYEELERWRDKILAQARKNPQLLNIDSDYDPRKIQLNLDIHYQRAAELGVSLAEIGGALETLLGSKTLGTFIDRDEEYDVILEAQLSDKARLQDLKNIYVRSATTNTLIPLANLAELKEVTVPNALYRFNRSKAITITANLAPGYSLGAALDFLENVAKKELPQEARLDYKGESRDLRETQGGMVFAFSLTSIILLLVMAAQFGSFIHPLVIFITAPLAIVGAMLGLYLGGNSFNIYSQIGMIMLMGLAAKNGILIVEFINQLREDKRHFFDAILEGSAIRLRPVLMTAVSTLFGSIPLIMASGAGSENRISIGLVLFFGISFSTLLSLFAVPVFYAKIARRTKPRNYVSQRLARQKETSRYKGP
ncbi:MAG: efflux RND transporter permease subunit [Legionellaceae bacterium]|nr:efflux RND transporter permease subunit [Legionellaceae bacterium]